LDLGNYRKGNDLGLGFGVLCVACGLWLDTGYWVFGTGFKGFMGFLYKLHPHLTSPIIGGGKALPLIARAESPGLLARLAVTLAAVSMVYGKN